jgi:hypothetical protein
MRIRRVAGTVLSFWRVAYDAGTWRRMGYAIAAVPVCVVCPVLALAGRAGTAARYQRSLANGLTGHERRESRR